MGTSPGSVAARVVALLLGLAGAVAAEPQQVSAVLGESVLLSLDLPHNKMVKTIDWTFKGDTSATLLVAEVIPGGFQRPDPLDRFGERLEVNETALRIRDLARGDCGIYTARIQWYPAALEYRSFNLSLYEPLPEPQIQIQEQSLDARECNLTLRCQLPAGSAALITWWPRGHLCGDSQTLCLSLPGTNTNASYTCVAWNGIQERNVTILTGTLCHPKGDKDRDRLRVLICLGLVVLGVGAAGITWMWRKKRRKKGEGSEQGSAREDGPERAALAPSPSQDPSPEVVYCQIQRRISLEPQERDNPTSIYSLVRA